METGHENKTTRLLLLCANLAEKCVPFDGISRDLQLKPLHLTTTGQTRNQRLNTTVHNAEINTSSTVFNETV